MLDMQDIGSENVLAMTLDGKLDQADVRRISEALDERLAAHERIRVYFETGDSIGITAKGLLEDVRYGVRRFGDLATRIERVAVVADQKWLRTLTALEGRLFPAVEERAFPRSEREEAIRWITEPAPTA